MDGKWTQKMVAARMEEAASILRRLPGERPAGYVSSWPTVIHEAMEAYGWNDVELRPGPPPADAITRMDESLEWLRWIAIEDVRLVWLRAEQKPWKELARLFGACRTTIWSRWMAALLEIATHLNAGYGKKGV